MIFVIDVMVQVPFSAGTLVRQLSIISANLKHHDPKHTNFGQSVMHALVLSLPICRPNLKCLTSHFQRCYWDSSKFKVDHMTGGSVVNWLACWTQA